jgi:predicted XRE-type DNA-binding protein
VTLAPAAYDRYHPPDMTQANPHIGSSFESFLKEERILEECTATAIKRVLARQIEHAMQERGLTKSAMSKAMRTSRPQVDRLLDPANHSVTLDTLQRAAAFVGQKLHAKLA